ncbi:MAG TPA: ABC transporter, partial [Cytophagales bacterium]|nr:ABC transporter [Cytophagales bacterium]
MSEEILKALTQLFAIITKQDGGVTENERQFVINFFQQELDQDTIKEYVALYDEISGYGKQDEEKNRLTSVKDSVKTLGICKKINKTLTQKQKVVVLTKLLELIGSDKNFTPQRIEIINTVSTVFNIGQDEYKLVETFIIAEQIDQLNFKDILVVNSAESKAVENQKHSHAHI